MVDPDRDLHEGVVEVDRGSGRKSDFAGDVFFEPGPLAKSSVGARSAGKPKPRRRGAKYPNTRSGRLRLAVIADNSAKSIEAFVRANVKSGATVITYGHASYTGLSGDYRHDPRRRRQPPAKEPSCLSPMKRWAWHVSRPADTPTLPR
jgi:ISXO2-like transposase domain